MKKYARRWNIFKIIREAELSLDILAELSCMSKNYFCTCFKKTMQMTVGEYTELVRINRAAILAETTDLPVTEICYQCGYGRYYKL